MSVAQFRSVAQKLSRILRREGLAGVANRLRHTPLRLFQRKMRPVSLVGGALIEDHLSDPVLTELVAAAVPPHRGDGPHPTVHIGCPGRTVGSSDIVILAGQPCPARDLSQAALVAESEPSRLAQLERAGCNVVAMGAPPYDATSLRRFQILTRIVAPSAFDYAPFIAPALDQTIPRLCLTLPEFPERMQQFQQLNRWEFQMVPGLRVHPPWAGAAHSYARLATQLLDAGRSRAMIVQDDMLPGPDFDRRLEIAEDYFVRSGADMFAGLVTDFDESFVLRAVVQHEGMTFLHLNKSVGLVCNMFGARALRHLASWRKEMTGPGEAPYTIDRYMAAALDFDVVTTLPFLVRHRSNARSTIWSFGNGRYETLIDYSERQLMKLAAAHR